MWSQRAVRVVSNLIAGMPPDQRIGTHAARLNALPIGVDMWADYYLRASGEVVIVGSDLYEPDVDTLVTDWTRVLAVLVWGARRYPGLAALIPSRPPGATDCDCLQRPEWFGSGKLICQTCGGVGWLPPAIPLTTDDPNPHQTGLRNRLYYALSRRL